MIKIGITGNIASGKTLIETFLKEEGVLTIDGDIIAHDLLENDTDTINKVNELFYPLNIKDENGKLSRKEIAEIVFADCEQRAQGRLCRPEDPFNASNQESKLKELEKIIHPKVIEKIQEFFNKNKDNQIVAAVVPLLYEAKMEKMFDFIIVVIVDKATQLKRLMERNKFTEEEALSRINSQTSSEEKAEKAHFVINNNLSTESTKTQLKEILKTISRVKEN